MQPLLAPRGSVDPRIAALAVGVQLLSSIGADGEAHADRSLEGPAVSLFNIGPAPALAESDRRRSAWLARVLDAVTTAVPATGRRPAARRRGRGCRRRRRGVFSFAGPGSAAAGGAVAAAPAYGSAAPAARRRRRGADCRDRAGVSNVTDWYESRAPSRIRERVFFVTAVRHASASLRNPRLPAPATWLPAGALDLLDSVSDGHSQNPRPRAAARIRLLSAARGYRPAAPFALIARGVGAGSDDGQASAAGSERSGAAAARRQRRHVRCAPYQIVRQRAAFRARCPPRRPVGPGALDWRPNR